MKKIILMSLIGIVYFTSVNAQLRLNAGGLVGVGTPNMFARLNIEPQLTEPEATNLLIGNWDTTGQGCVSIGVNYGYSWIQTWNNTPLYINSKGNDVLFFHDVGWGKVGINIPAPSSSLHVQGNIVASGTVT